MRKKIQRRAVFTKKRSGKQSFKFWFIAIAASLGLFYGGVFLLPVVPSNSNSSDKSTYRVKIASHSGLTSIANQLSDQGIAINPLTIHTASRLLFIGSKLKPGTYLLPTKASLGSMLLQLARGDRVRESIAIIPGMTISQVRSAIDSHPAITHQTKSMDSKELLRSLNLSYPGDEGIFLPDTYIFDPDELDLDIYRMASQGMQKQLAQIWEQKATGLPFKTPYELLILASIVEKETGRSSDRGMVSAVFVNRLKRGMPLQTDPTVIYGIGTKFDGNLRKADLRKDTPYNTYMHKGLPPTPIAMPSKESIMAAAHPAKTDALFFVAKGDGSSHFSQNLKEHELAVDRYQRKISPKTNSN